MKLYFIRHGQTDANKIGIVQGQEVDLLLNETGIKQVEDALRYLPETIDNIISSPLKRARHTAEIISKKLNKHLEFNDDIKEFRYGSLAGKTWAEIEAETGDISMREKDANTLFNYRPFGGESAEDLKERVKKFVIELQNTHAGKTVLVVTHGGVISAMHVLFPQKEKREGKNATLHEFFI